MTLPKTLHKYLYKLKIIFLSTGTGLHMVHYACGISFQSSIWKDYDTAPCENLMLFAMSDCNCLFGVTSVHIMTPLATLFLKVPTTNSEKDAMSEGTQLYIIFQNIGRDPSFRETAIDSSCLTQCTQPPRNTALQCRAEMMIELVELHRAYRASVQRTFRNRQESPQDSTPGGVFREPRTPRFWVWGEH